MPAAATLARSRLREARAAALAAIGPYVSAAATTVQYRSHGCVLVAGDALSIHSILGALPPPLKIVAFASGPSRAAPVPDNVNWVPARVVAIEGHLGRFTAHARGPNDQPIDCGPASAHSIAPDTSNMTATHARTLQRPLAAVAFPHAQPERSASAANRWPSIHTVARAAACATVSASAVRCVMRVRHSGAAFHGSSG
jgi:hypothetical protein